MWLLGGDWEIEGEVSRLARDRGSHYALSMKRFLFLVIGFGVLSSDAGRAHVAARGDGGASVVVEAGKFAVYFSDSILEKRFRMLFTPDGKLLAPRHEVKSYPDVASTTLGFPFPRVSFGGKEIQVARANPRNLVFMFSTACVSETHQAIDGCDEMAILNEAEDGFRYYIDLFKRDGFSLPESFFIGVPASIYDFPTASNIVYANERFWVAWVRGYEMVLSSVRPGDEKAVERVLDVPADWNSSLSLAVINNQLCLAYGCSVNHDYPGTSQLITTFVKAE
jgi:hypothetical protein